MRTNPHRLSLGEILLALCLLTPLPARAAAPPPQIPGYQMVQADPHSVNRIVLTVFVNGHPEDFIVDTGAWSTMLSRSRSEKDGVKLTEADSKYGQYRYYKGEEFRVGQVDSLQAGTMSFGSGPILLFDAGRANFSFTMRNHREETNGFLGADVLLRYKSIINTRTRQIFFQTDPRHAINLALAVEKMGFTQVPLHMNEHHSIVVDCTLNGTPGHMVIDTGAFYTHINTATARAVHLPVQGSDLSLKDVTGERHPVDYALVRNLRFGSFTMPEQHIFVVEDPIETEGPVAAQIFGLLGDDVLATMHGIIDLGSMSLFVK